MPNQNAAKEFSPTWGLKEGINTEDVANGEPEIVVAVEGKIISVFDPEEKEGKYGPYTMQNAKLETDSGEISATLFNVTIEKSEKGKRFSARCGKTKNGLKGIRYEIQSWLDKKTKEDRHKEVLIFDDNCIFDVGSSQASGAKPASAPRPSSPAPKAQTRVEYDQLDFEAALKNLVIQHAVVDQAVREVYPDRDEETKRAYTSTIWIALDRLGFITATAPQSRQDAPRRAETSEEGDHSGAQDKADSYDPADWASAIIPTGSMAGNKLGEIGKQALKKLAYYRLDNNKSGGFWECVIQADKDLGLTEIPF